MIGDLPQFPGVLCPAPCKGCTAVCVLVCRHPDECVVSVAHCFCFVYCLNSVGG